MDSIVDDRWTRVVERGLDYASLRQQVLANNIANINTPQFRRSDVSFSQMMQSKSSQAEGFQESLTHQNHIPFGSNAKSGLNMFVHNTNDTMYRNDKNNVDVNREMAESAKNALYHQSLTQMAARRFRLIKDVVRGR